MAKREKKYFVYYDSKSHGEKFNQKVKRRWFVNDPAGNPDKDGKPLWSYERKDAMELGPQQTGTAILFLMLFGGYHGLKKVEV